MTFLGRRRRDAMMHRDKHLLRRSNETAPRKEVSIPTPGRTSGKKGGRQCFHGGLQSREETPKEGICGRSCRTATISAPGAGLASAFFVRYAAYRGLALPSSAAPEPDSGTVSGINFIKSATYAVKAELSGGRAAQEWG